MTAVVLTSATAKCPVEGCSVTKSQIDSTRERAVQVVTDAMNRHIEEEHPDD